MSPKSAAVVPQTPAEVVEHIAIEYMDLAAIAEAQAEGGVYEINALDLEHVAPMSRGIDGFMPGTTLEVVVLHKHNYRIYYPHPDNSMEVRKYNKDDVAPPACASWDGVTGYGNPGGECAVCPFGQYGGPCKPQMMVYGLPVDKTMPLRISIPTTSIRAKISKEGRKAGHENASFLGKAAFMVGKPLTAFVTVLGCEAAPGNKEKIVTFSKGADLSPAARAAAKSYAESFKGVLTFPVQGVKAQPKQLAAVPDITARPQLTEPSAFNSEHSSAYADDQENDDTIPF